VSLTSSFDPATRVKIENVPWSSPTQKNEPIVHNTLITRTSKVPSSSQQKGTHNSQQHLVKEHSSKCGILGSRL